MLFSETREDEPNTLVQKPDLITFMKSKLPEYVVNCFLMAGYDEEMVIADMDISENESNSISKIENYIEKRCKQNPAITRPDTLLALNPSAKSLPFEFPPGHRIRICNFVKEVKEMCQRKMQLSSCASTTVKTGVKKRKLMIQSDFQVPSSAEEISTQVHKNINKWLNQQQTVALNSLKNGHDFSVHINKDGKGCFSVLVKCLLCSTSIRLHQLNSTFQISNWTRHVKKCADRRKLNSKQAKLDRLLHRVPPPTDKQNSPSQPVSVNESVVSTSLPENASQMVDKQNDCPESSSEHQVFYKAPPSL